MRVGKVASLLGSQIETSQELAFVLVREMSVSCIRRVSLIQVVSRADDLLSGSISLSGSSEGMKQEVKNEDGPLSQQADSRSSSISAGAEVHPSLH